MTARSITSACAALLVQVAAGPAPGAATLPEGEAFRAAARVIEAHCVRCHSGPQPEGGLSLEPRTLYRETVNAPSRAQAGLRIVDPGRPEDSTLYRKLLPPGEGRYRGPRMPMHADILADADVAAIRAWIFSFPPGTWDGEAAAPEQAAVAGAAGAPDPAQTASPSPRTAAGSRTAAARPAPTFQNGHLVNLPTPDTLGSKGLEFRILHRFKQDAGDAGSQNLWGLDSGAWISFGLAAALGERIDVGLRRTNFHQDWEAYGKWSALRQERGGSPVALSLVGLAAHVSADNRFNEDRLGAQLVLGRRFGDRLSGMLVPMYVSHTHVHDPADTRGTYALGVGGEFRFNSYMALTGEWITQLSGVMAPFESGSVGLSLATSRHVFHVFASNTSGSHTDQYAPGGDLDWSGGDFRLGFNITRTFDRSLFGSSRRATRNEETSR